MASSPSPTLQSRGPADHAVREQIVEAARQHFSRYGYGKTTVSDLAKSIGFSKAYIYKFFDSKDAIGEAICATTLTSIVSTVEEAVATSATPTEKIRKMFKVLVETGVHLFFTDRQLYDVAAHAAREQWPSVQSYCARMQQILADIVREGRERGEFERKTPFDETVQAINLVLQPFVNPLLLQHHLDMAEAAPAQLSGLVLRSLAP